MKIWKMIAGDRTLDMEMGPPHYQLTTDSHNFKKLCFFTVRETQFPNITWMRIITLSLRFPFIGIFGGFIAEEE